MIHDTSISRSLTATSIEFLNRLQSTPRIGANAITQFVATPNPTSQGVDVSFGVTDSTGMGSISLSRATVPDRAQSTTIQTWTAKVGSYLWSDTDAVLRQSGQAYYWLTLEPSNTITGTPVQVGPQYILLNPDLVAPLEALNISASHSAAANGFVLVTCNVAGVPSGGSVQIAVSGYKGIAANVVFAQQVSSPIQFNLEDTGETVTLTALAVSSGGVATTTGPQATLTLAAAATVPAAPQGLSVAQIATGNQLSFPASRETNVTGYLVYRGQRNTSFLSASQLATLAASSSGTVVYLDTAGLTGDFQYFVLATSALGNSLPSPPANPSVLYSSVSIPPNVPTNTTNYATVDSVADGTTALVRIYGPGGVGTGYTRVTGFGTISRPYGSITGLAFTTAYYVMYTSAGNYLATTSYPSTLPDGYEFVGLVTTCGPSTATGSGATATAVINTSGNVIQINVTAAGSGYSAATINIAGGGGSGAQATAVLSGSGIGSITVTNGGSGYTSAPAVTIVPGIATGTAGGGGTGGGPTGCCEEGTFVIVPDGSTEEVLPCEEWVALDLGKGPLKMHPDTLVSVWKLAAEINCDDRVEVMGARWVKPVAVQYEHRTGRKVKRSCPGGAYHAGPSLVRVHNMKAVVVG